MILVNPVGAIGFPEQQPEREREPEEETGVRVWSRAGVREERVESEAGQERPARARSSSSERIVRGEND